MRSNGNCRGISYWEYERTGNTATAVPVTVYNPESIGRRGSPLPSARSTIRSSRFGDSRIETWSRISRYFQSQIFSFGVSKRNLVEKKRAPEKKGKKRGRKKWLERDRNGEEKKKKKKKKEETWSVEVRGGGKDWNCGCGGNAIHGGRGTDRYVAADRQLLWLQLELSGTSRQRRRRAASLCCGSKRRINGPYNAVS